MKANLYQIMRSLLLACLTLGSGVVVMKAEPDKPYYYQIPAAPDSFTGPNVAARLVDGLGFRYYWATEGLRPEDLEWSPDGGETAGKTRRTTADTLDHIYELAQVVANATWGKPTINPSEREDMSFAEKREATLALIRVASDNLRAASEADMVALNLVFQSSENGSTKEYPFWNVLNGPIADALWHTGQVVSFRRSSGNPFDSKVGVLTGKRRE